MGFSKKINFFRRNANYNRRFWVCSNVDGTIHWKYVEFATANETKTDFHLKRHSLRAKCHVDGIRREIVKFDALDWNSIWDKPFDSVIMQPRCILEWIEYSTTLKVDCCVFLFMPKKMREKNTKFEKFNENFSTMKKETATVTAIATTCDYVPFESLNLCIQFIVCRWSSGLSAPHLNQPN